MVSEVFPRSVSHFSHLPSRLERETAPRYEPIRFMIESLELELQSTPVLGSNFQAKTRPATGDRRQLGKDFGRDSEPFRKKGKTKTKRWNSEFGSDSEFALQAPQRFTVPCSGDLDCRKRQLVALRS